MTKNLKHAYIFKKITSCTGLNTKVNIYYNIITYYSRHSLPWV